MKFFIKLFAVVTNRLSELQMGWGPQTENPYSSLFLRDNENPYKVPSKHT